MMKLAVKGDVFVGYIYKITNLINNKVYIGQTSRTIEKRWKEHLRHGFNPNNAEYQRHLYKSMRKYGKEAFTIETVESCDNDLMSERETFWVKFYNSTDPKFGYNLTFGGEGTVSIDYDEVYRRFDNGEMMFEIAKNMNISRSNLTQILKGYSNYNKDEVWDKTKQYLSVSRGRAVSQYDVYGNFIATFPSAKAAARAVPKATHANIGKSCKNKTGLSGGFQWRFSDDLPPGVYTGVQNFSKPVCQLDMSYNLIAVFSSISEAAQATNIDPSSISKCCNHCKQYHMAGGYIWQYEYEYNTGVDQCG